MMKKLIHTNKKIIYIMEQLKKWDEFFDKKNNGIIKENLNIPVNPNQFTIVYQEQDEVNGEVLYIRNKNTTRYILHKIKEI